MERGSLITLVVEKPAVGGRMLARHNGQIVLVWGAIPGERIRARIERVGRGVLYAETAEVLDASPDRRHAAHDWRCGGNAYAHIAYERQVRLKGEIIRETLGRIGRLPLSEPPAVEASPERGYRMRARLHAQGHQLGFLREGTHQLCDAGSTGQLLPATAEWIAAAEAVLLRDRLDGLSALEITENIQGNERACHLVLQAGVEATPFAALTDAEPLTGVSAEREDRAGTELLAGSPWVSDVLHMKSGDAASALRLRRSARAFFQGNRYLLEPLVRHVAALVPEGPVVDLYAGVGLFGLSLAAAGIEHVTLVEGDPVSGADLQANAEAFGERVRVDRCSVEAFLAHAARAFTAREADRKGEARTVTFIVDPPRTGISKEAMAGTLRALPARIVYVSCDVATFARDTRTLLDSGYELGAVTGFDLFPNTAHVETVAFYSRSSSVQSSS
jgi:tRNA/tmRNA/rRNA uracil-C5-methylase (TrmA/RlmC/RlmD family)